MQHTFSLGKPLKLKGKKNIETLLQHGEAFFAYPYRVIFLKKKIEENIASSKDEQYLAVAIAVPKKKWRLAHDRNRIKRVTRECLRLQKNDLFFLLKEKKINLKVMIQYVQSKPIIFAEAEKGMSKLLTFLAKQAQNAE